jgi:hypothetical protein
MNVSAAFEEDGWKCAVFCFDEADGYPSGLVWGVWVGEGGDGFPNPAQLRDEVVMGNGCDGGFTLVDWHTGPDIGLYFPFLFHSVT